MKMSEGNEFTASQPQACPFCATEQGFEECVTHDSTDDGDLEFLWECEHCENRFTTIKPLDTDGIENHTLMWVETDEHGVTQVLHIEGGEDCAGVEWKRAQFNMMECRVYEVHGRDWAVERLFEMFKTMYDLPDESDGAIRIPGDKETNGS